jgi:NADH-quinone oxidoreductase subunit G
MVEIEIDGQKVEVPEGSMVMDAASRLGTYIPHFCYHKKLSIAANCRMCLVEVEKAPKPLPACATPVTAGMKVHTRSDKARQAQKSVMEFLLINHPLDCPICDQGGECQLQDLAVGYGPSASRYSEEKRVVFHKPMGPLISAEEMSRCIHCTRCVRFGQEIAGVMELGMAGRGEHSEIMSFVGNAIESELSGNMIDICPVGALTSKPFRYSARTWELSRKRSISPHDSIGANIVIQSKGQEVKRVVPFENEAVNECWISDRDRFAYEGLNSPQRLTSPMIRQADGQWREASWDEALAKAATALKEAGAHGPNQVRTLASPNSTLEELHLAAALTRALASDSVDFRPRLGESGFDRHFRGVPTLGMPLADVNHLDRALVVGSFLRQDHPLLAQRLRQAVRHGAKVAVLHATAEPLLMPLAHQMIASPSRWRELLGEIASAAITAKGLPMPAAIQGVVPTDNSRLVAEMLMASADCSRHAAILLGNSVMAHPQASQLWATAQMISDATGARIGFTVEGGNGVGGYIAGAVPRSDGFDAATMFDTPAQAYVLLNVDPSMDCLHPAKAVSALRTARTVVGISAFRDGVMDVAHVVLPAAPYTETSGSYINCEGRLQNTQAVVRPAGQARPAWKILRVLGNLVSAAGFDAESTEEIRLALLPGVGSGEAVPGLAVRIDPDTHDFGQTPQSSESRFTRIADVPIYRSDAVVRHAAALGQTRASASPSARMHPADLQEIGTVAGARLRFTQPGCAPADLPVVADPTVARGVVCLAAGHAVTAGLGPMIGPIALEAI